MKRDVHLYIYENLRMKNIIRYIYSYANKQNMVGNIIYEWIYEWVKNMVFYLFFR